MKKIILFSVLLLYTYPLSAGNWPRWRGPFSNGSADEKNLPESFSPTENVVWTADLPGPGASTPIVWDHRVFLTAAANDSSLYALCLDVADGKILWQKKVGVDDVHIQRNNMASPSAVTDGKSVFFLFGIGDLAAFDVSGKSLWTRKLAKDHGPFNLKFGYSSSPLLYENKLYVVVMRRDSLYRNFASQPGPLDSFLLAIDARTGKDLFRHQRTTDAIGESRDAYTSPILYRHPKRTEIILVGSDYVTGHDPASGKEFWRLGYNPRHRNQQRVVPSAVPGPDLIYAVMPRGGQPLYAIKAGGDGEIAWNELAWVYEQGGTPDVCTPLLYQDRLYVLDGNRKTMTCLDPQSGKQLWQGKLGGSAVYRASPTGTDDKIYCITESGEAVVLAAGPEFKILTRVQMGGRTCRASISAAQGRLFIHSDDKLYCIGN